MSESASRQQFTELLRQHQNQLFGYIFSLVRSMEDTQDVFQQTSLVLWKKFDGFEPGSNFVAWACNVARLDAMNFLRKRNKQPQLFSPEVQERLADMQAAIEEETSDQQEALTHCLDELPTEQRRLLWDCYDGQRTVREVAVSLDRTTHSVHSSLRHTRKTLLDCMRRFLSREANQ